MKLKGLKKACTETKFCRNDGYGGVCEIALNLETGELYSTFMVSINNHTVWKENEPIINVLFTRFPMTMIEIEQRVSETLMLNSYKILEQKFDFTKSKWFYA